jgi:hypothetical protein
LHTLTLSKTNSYGIVAVCACGWIGGVHPSHHEERPNGKRGARDYDGALAKAAAEHRHHVKVDGPLRVHLVPENYVGTVMNSRRFGHA